MSNSTIEEAVALAENLQHMAPSSWRWRTRLVVGDPQLVTIDYTSPSLALQDVGRLRELYCGNGRYFVMLQMSVTIEV